jgi:GMP reductase
MKSLKYSDVALVPKYSEALTRASCDTSIKIGGRNFQLPIIPANMKSVIDTDIASWMSEKDYFYIMHRFDIDILKFISQANSENWKNISISLGVKKHDEKIIEYIREKKLRVDFITIDIAHGYSLSMKKMIEYIKAELNDTMIIAGNVATPDAVVSLSNWGADIVKVGIGQGSPCTTKDKTGFTMPMFTCARQCGDCYASRDRFDVGAKIPIIADGGVTCNGDIAKALVSGADLVMAGGMFAACTDSPSLSTKIDNLACKGYFGSASVENKGHNKNIEGKLITIPSNQMTYEEKLEEVKQDLQSAISYGGGLDLNCLKEVKHTEL